MRLLATIAVFFGSFAALAFLGIWISGLLGGNAWWGMILIYPELAAAIAITVLFARRWKARSIDPNGHTPS